MIELNTDADTASSIQSSGYMVSVGCPLPTTMQEKYGVAFHSDKPTSIKKVYWLCETGEMKDAS